jgi:hypothetical protein
VKAIGLLTILFCLAFALWCTAKGKKRAKSIFGVSLVGMLFGLALILNDRITEFTLEHVGSIKTAEKEAVSNAAEIANIRKRVEAQSATVDLVAQRAGDAMKLAQEVEKAREDMGLELDRVRNATVDADKAVRELRELADFTRAVTGAESDDRASLDRLKAWADDPKYPMVQLARQALVKVRIYYSGYDIRPTPSVEWDSSAKFQQLTFGELRELYRNSSPHQHAALVQQIWRRTDIPKADRMGFLIEVMKTDASINAVDYSRKLFYPETNLKHEDMAALPLVLDPLYDWWEQNKNTVK